MAVNNHILSKAGEYSAEEQLTIDTVDKQLLAYNNQGIVAFAATYHDDVEIHHFSGGLQYKGKQELISRYGPKYSVLTSLLRSHPQLAEKEGQLQ